MALQDYMAQPYPAEPLPAIIKGKFPAYLLIIKEFRQNFKTLSYGIFTLCDTRHDNLTSEDHLAILPNSKGYILCTS